MGNDMSKLTASGYSILANPAIIAVNQDPLGVAATYRWTRNNVQLWSGPLVSTTGSSINDVVVVLFNNGGSATTASATLSAIFGSSNVPSSQFEIRDLWASRLSDSQAQAILNYGAAAHASCCITQLPKAIRLDSLKGIRCCWEWLSGRCLECQEQFLSQFPPRDVEFSDSVPSQALPPPPPPPPAAPPPLHPCRRQRVRRPSLNRQSGDNAVAKAGLDRLNVCPRQPVKCRTVSVDPWDQLDLASYTNSLSFAILPEWYSQCL